MKAEAADLRGAIASSHPLGDRREAALLDQTPLEGGSSGSNAPPLDVPSHDSVQAAQALPRGPAELRLESVWLDEDPADAGHEVWLHVYDLGPITCRLNELVLRGANLGAFHCGIEVLGDEWSFQGFHDAWDDPSLSGVVRNEPRQHPAYIYRESILLGRTPLSEDEIDALLDTALEDWPANTYHLVLRNCVTFAEEFAATLRVPEPFPAWVRGAIDAGKSPPLLAIADYGWSWFKWWTKRQAEQEAAAVQGGSASSGAVGGQQHG